MVKGETLYYSPAEKYVSTLVSVKETLIRLFFISQVSRTNSTEKHDLFI